ncbi:MAG: hypothetical protein JXQ84_00900 [Rhodospirillaceae bacterium]|nr:hypothetical protein [Rhodospirillaceae bacterium]
MHIAPPKSCTTTKQPASFSGAQEPKLTDLYGDPLLHAILRRDGVDLSALKAVVAAAQKRLAA